MGDSPPPREAEILAEKLLALVADTSMLRMYPIMSRIDDHTILHIGGITYEDSVRPVFHLIRLRRDRRGRFAVRCIDAFHVAADQRFPEHIAQHTAVAATRENGDAVVYIIGNYNEATSRVFCLDIATRELRCVLSAHLPHNLHCHTSVLVQGSAGPAIYTFGGASGRYSTNDMYVFHVNSEQWSHVPAPPSGRVPAARLYHMSCAVGRYVYIFGGAPDVKSTRAGDPVFSDFWRYDTEKNEWEELPSASSVLNPDRDAPTPRGSAVMQFVAPYIYVFGGFDGAEALGDTYRFDVDLRKWANVSKRICLPPQEPVHADVGDPFTRECSEMLRAGSTASVLEPDVVSPLPTTAPASAAAQTADSCHLPLDDFGCRWASGSCVVDGSIFIAGGFAPKPDGSMVLCDRLDAMAFSKPTLREIAARQLVQFQAFNRAGPVGTSNPKQSRVDRRVETAVNNSMATAALPIKA